MHSSELVADHSLLLALPAFAPAVVVVGVVIWVAMRDRRNADDESSDGDDVGDDPAHSQVQVSADEDGSP